ncbi:unnamed protein product [Dicrocoelium dendriticum]|nr:unnamed protein product [Dicrocoelium dendriticum]
MGGCCSCCRSEKVCSSAGCKQSWRRGKLSPHVTYSSDDVSDAHQKPVVAAESRSSDADRTSRSTEGKLVTSQPADNLQPASRNFATYSRLLVHSQEAQKSSEITKVSFSTGLTNDAFSVVRKGPTARLLPEDIQRRQHVSNTSVPGDIGRSSQVNFDTSNNALPQYHNMSSDSSQFRHVYSLLTTENLDLRELALTMPSLKALLHDQALAADNTGFLVQCLRSIINRVGSVLERSTAGATFCLTMEERMRLKEALHLAKLPVPMGTADLPELSTDASVLDHSQTGTSAWLLATLEQVASEKRLPRDRYLQLRYKLQIIVESASKSINGYTQVSPEPIIKDIEALLKAMDLQSCTSPEVRIEQPLAQASGYLVDGFKTFRSLLDSKIMKASLIALYNASRSSDWRYDPYIVLDALQAATVVEAMQTANHEYQFNPILRLTEAKEPRNLWSLSAELVRRMQLSLSNHFANNGSTVLRLDPKEALLIQHVLTTVLNANGFERTPEESEMDATFFKFCASNSVTKEDDRSTDVLSPIFENGTPESSICEGESTSPHSYQFRSSPTNSHGLNNTNYHKFDVKIESACVSSTKGKSPLSVDISSMTNETPDKLQNSHLHTTLEDDNLSVSVNSGIVSSILAYLRLKKLPKLTTPTSSLTSDCFAAPIEPLLCALDSRLKDSTQTQVSLSTTELEMLRNAMSDGNPYSRILTKCLEKVTLNESLPHVSTSITHQLETLPSIADIAELPGTLAGVHSARLLHISKILESTVGENLPSEYTHEFANVVLSQAPAIGTRECSQLFATATEIQQKNITVKVTPELIQQFNTLIRARDEFSDDTLPLSALTSPPRSHSQHSEEHDHGAVIGDIGDDRNKELEKPKLVSSLVAIHTLSSAAACLQHHPENAFNFTGEQLNTIRSCLLSVAKSYPAVGPQQQVEFNDSRQICLLIKHVAAKVLKLPSYQWETQSIVRKLSDSATLAIPTVYLQQALFSGILVCCMQRYPVAADRLSDLLRLIQRTANNSGSKLCPEDRLLLRWFAQTVAKALQPNDQKVDLHDEEFSARFTAKDEDATSALQTAASLLACVTQRSLADLNFQHVCSEFNLLSKLSEAAEKGNLSWDPGQLDCFGAEFEGNKVQEKADSGNLQSAKEVGEDSHVTTAAKVNGELSSACVPIAERPTELYACEETSVLPSSQEEVAKVYQSFVKVQHVLDRLMCTDNLDTDVVLLAPEDSELLVACLQTAKHSLPEVETPPVFKQFATQQQLETYTSDHQNLGPLTLSQISELRGYATHVIRTAQRRLDADLKRVMEECFRDEDLENYRQVLQPLMARPDCLQDELTADGFDSIGLPTARVSESEVGDRSQKAAISNGTFVQYRQNSLTLKPALLLKLLQLRRKLAHTSQELGGLTRAEKCFGAFVLRHTIAQADMRDTSDATVATQEMVSELTRAAEMDHPLDPKMIQILSSQLDDCIQQLTKQVRDEVSEATRNSQGCATEQDAVGLFGAVATLIWSQGDEGPLSSAASLTEQVKTVGSISQYFGPAIYQLVEAPLSLSPSLALSELQQAADDIIEVSTPVKDPIITEPAIIAKLFVHCARVAQFSHVAGISSWYSMDTLAGQLLESVLHSTPIPRTLIERIQNQVSDISSVAREETIKSLKDSFAMIRQSVDSMYDRHLDSESSTSPISEAQHDVDQRGMITVQGTDCELLTNSLELVLYSDIHPSKANLMTLTGVLQQLRVCSSLIQLDPCTARFVAEALSDSIMLLGSKHQKVDRMDSKSDDDQNISIRLPTLEAKHTVTPEEAVDLLESIITLNNDKIVKTCLTCDQRCALHMLKNKLIRANLDNHTTLMSELSNLVGEPVQNLFEQINQVRNQQEADQRNQLIHRLELIQAIAMEVQTEYPDSLYTKVMSPTQRIDPSTTGQLHRCLLNAMHKNPPTLFTMLPLLSVNLELENSKDITDGSVDPPDTHQAYVPVDISLAELKAVTSFLRCSPTGNPSLTEQLAALVCIQRMMDGTPLWPSEAALLLASLQTLAGAHDVARRQLLCELEDFKNRLIACAFSGENEDELYEGAGFELTEDDCKQLRSLHRVCEISVTRKARQFIQNAVECWSSENKEHPLEANRLQIMESLRIVLLYLSRRVCITLDETILLNRITAMVSSGILTSEAVSLLRELLNTDKLFALHEMGTTEEETSSLPVHSNRVPHDGFTVFIPDMLEQLLGNDETEESLPPGSLFLLFNLLHVITVVTSRPDGEKLASKWVAHLRRLVWRVLNSALLGYSMKLDVRSRTLALVACKRYRTVLANEAENAADEVLSALSDSKDFNELSFEERWKIADTLSVAVVAPLRYGFTPVRVGFLAKLAQALRSLGTGSVFTLSENQLMVATLCNIRDQQHMCAEVSVNTADMLIGLQTIEQYMDDFMSSSDENICLDLSDSATLNAALQCILTTSAQPTQSDSWDIEEQSDGSTKHLTALGTVCAFLSAASVSETNWTAASPLTQSFHILKGEFREIQELVNFWKTRLLLDSQKQRTASIRKLSVSNECDITADMNNVELANALQLSVLHGQPQHPYDSLVCIHTLANLCNSPAAEYISISDTLRDALRLTLCSTKTANVATILDPSLVASVFSVNSLMYTSLELDTSTTNNVLGICAEPTAIASWTTGLRSILSFLENHHSVLEHQSHILQRMERRMRYSAAKLETYWISTPESEAVQQVLEHLLIQMSEHMIQRLRSLLCELEEGSNRLSSVQQQEMLQMLRIYHLIGSPLSQRQYCALVQLLDHLTFDRLMCVTQQHKAELKQLIQSFTPTRNRSMPPRYHLSMIQVCLNNLLKNNSPLLNVTSFPLRLNCREAALILTVIQQLCSAGGSCSSELTMLQSALCYCIAAGEPFTLHNVLSVESKQSILDNLRNCSNVLLDQLKDNSAQTSLDSIDIDLLKAFTDRLFCVTETEMDVSYVWRLLELISHVLPTDSYGQNGRRLRRIAPVEQESIEDNDLSVANSVAFNAIQQIENLCDANNAINRVERIVGLLKQVRVLRQHSRQLKLNEEDEDRLHHAEQMMFQAALAHVQTPSSTEHSARSFNFDLVKQVVSRVVEQLSCPTKPISSTDSLGPSPLAESSTSVATGTQPTGKPASSGLSQMHQSSTIQALDEVYKEYGRILTLCNSPTLQPESVVQLTTCVDALHRATYQMSPGLKEVVQFSPTEKSLLQSLQAAADHNQSYELSVDATDVLQSLGQRLATMAIQSNRNVLRDGLEVWLSASVEGNFVFDTKDSQKLHSALRLARKIIQQDPSSGVPSDVLEVMDKLIRQFSSTADSGLGAEITGPHSMGPVVTQVLESAQRAQGIVGLPSYTVTETLFSNSELLTDEKPDMHGRYSETWSSTGLNSNTTEDAVSDRLDVESAPQFLKEAHHCRQTTYCDELQRDLHPTVHNTTAPNSVACTRSVGTAAPEEHPTKNTRSVQVTEQNPATESREHTISSSLLTSVAEEQKRLKVWERLVESRLTQACNRVEGLLAQIPQVQREEEKPTEGAGTAKTEELHNLRSEVLLLKAQLKQVLRQLQSAERFNQRQTMLTASMQRLMQQQQRQLSVLSMTSKGHQQSVEHTQQEARQTFPVDSAQNKLNRIYQSSDCLKNKVTDYLSGPVHGSQLILYKPVMPTGVDPSCSPPKEHRMSSLDRLHELIEIRRAVVAGSREELCRLGLYSSIPPKVPKPDVSSDYPIPDACSSGRASSEQREMVGPRVLRGLVERQRNYGRHLLCWSTYEHDQSIPVLDQLERRLTKLEQQLTNSERTSNAELASEFG